MPEPMSDDQITAAHARALDPDVTAGTLAFDVLNLCKEVDRLRAQLARATQFWHASEAECHAVQERLDEIRQSPTGIGR